MKRIFILLMMLSLATLACNFTGSDEPDEPTFVPISEAQAQDLLNSQTTPTATITPRPTETQVVNNNNNQSSQPVNNCVPRSDWLTYTVKSGETLGNIAVRGNTTVDNLVSGNCMANPNLLSVGQTIRVPFNVVPPTTTPAPNLCANSWFFTFKSGFPDAQKCPIPVRSSTAIGQDFEGGRVYWVSSAMFPEVPANEKPLGTIYVIYNDGYWTTYQDWADQSHGEIDTTVQSPANRFRPEGVIGEIWSNVPEVRNKLGWAYSPAETYTTYLQHETTLGGTDAIALYMYHGKGIVLQLVGQNMAPNPWQVAGSF